MKKKIIGILLVFCLSIASLSGCTFFSSISFTQESLTIGVGRTIDLDEYIQIKNSNSYEYSLTSNDDNIVQISSVTSIKAVSKGKTTITAQLNNGLKSAQIEIVVGFDSPSDMSLRTTGELFQSEESASAVTFIATADLDADPGLQFDWTVNGEPADPGIYRFDKKSFTLDKMSAGEYTIGAQCTDADIQAEKTVRVYKGLLNPILCYTQEEIFDTIPLSAPMITIDVDNPKDNPDLYIEWFVDGEMVESGFDNNPSFLLETDKVGKHNIYATLNGQRVYTTEGLDSVEITYKGAVTPDIDFEYENYPIVRLSWTNKEETMFKILVKRVSDAVIVFNKKIEVSTGECDLFEIIDLSKDYVFIVESLDSEDGIYQGGIFAQKEFFGLSLTAISYLEKRYLDKNYYMTCDEDIYDVFEYLMVYRPNTSANGTGDSSISVFMGYNSMQSPTELSNSFKERLNMTGAYRWSVAGLLQKNFIISINVTFYNDSAPNNISTKNKQAQSVYIPPKTSQTGMGDNDLLIEDYPLSASKVQTSDQLFIAVQRWLRPNLAESSAASRIYSKAKNILSSIIDIDMSDADKAAAIYDWVMFAVSYDYDVLSIEDTSLAVKQPAFYLEGVFDTGFAVCDGISKAYSLLCNMAGIECIRVVGSARSGGEWGEHAWNKVKLEGEWYIVDATWGIAKISGTSFKFGTRAWFLLNDSDVAGNRIEKGGVYPPTSTEKYNYYYKKGLYVFDNTDLNNVMAQLAQNLKQLRNDKAFWVGGKEYYTQYYTIEFEVSPMLVEKFARHLMNPLTNHLKGYYYSIHADAQVLNSFVVVAIE